MPASLITQGLLGLVGATASAAYLDAKFHISKDATLIRKFKEAERRYLQALKENRASGIFLFENNVRAHPDIRCLWSRSGCYTWQETYDKACQYAQHFQKLGVKRNEHVAVYLYNRPEFIFAWFGLMAIGAAPALINYNLASDALVHCVSIAQSKILLYDTSPDCVERIEGSRARLEELGISVIPLDAAFEAQIESQPKVRPEVDWSRGEELPFSILYTSGTTGLPKAARIPMARNYPAGCLDERAFDIKRAPSGDASYVCVPLYHGTGGFGTMINLMGGVSVAIGRKFSLTGFWQDCIDSQATIFIYVGELIRYLISAPPSENDKKHRIRVVWGNGLSPELWNTFRERFNVPEIAEFFGSTEGVFQVQNYARNPYFGNGAVGHHGILQRLINHKLIVPVFIDPETEDVWRDPKTGFAKRLPYDEGGEIMVKLPDTKAWHGYMGASGKKATSKKFLQDVFAKGDVYYRTGDALRRDGDGMWHFLDRLGDTYRWKGENVSTTEVTQVIGALSEIAEANVYGVKVPSHDGRAGCAAISFKTADMASRFSWAAMAKHLRAELPAYAVPIFVRVRNNVGSMGTHNHKMNKVPLRLEGIDPGIRGSKVDGGKDDTFMWLPAGAPEYVPFTNKDWKKLSKAQARI